jgi:type 1 glutamine amidotransferase
MENMRTPATAIAVVLLAATIFGVHQEASNPEMEADRAPYRECTWNDNLTCEGRVFYTNAVHHYTSYENPNMVEIVRNTVRYVSPSTTSSISVLAFANVPDRAQAIYDALFGQPDISPVMSTNQNDLLSLSTYDVVVVQSNGFDFSTSVEQSLADFANDGGGVIGGHDVIWNQNNNPILNQVFGAIAYGDGGNPGDGWFKGTVTVLKALDHPITTGIASSWSLLDEEYYFNMQFVREMVTVLETNHSGSLVPVAWTLLVPRIEAPVNLTTLVTGNDIRLTWANPNTSLVAYHMIYRATSPIIFDFANPVHDTSGDTNPKLEEWTDPGAASPLAPREYYYIVRAVHQFGVRSPTSMTAGKWTRQFAPGLNSFSLPLKPFESENISWYANNIAGVRTLDWLDNNGNWVRYDPGNPVVNNDTASRTGSTYQLVLASPTYHTFVGYPGTMIRYTERLGDSASFLDDLTLDVQGSDVVVTWVAAPGATRYHIFRSESREDIFDLVTGPIDSTILTTFWDPDILNGFSGELFYGIIAEDDYCGNGSSSYSKGLIRKVFSRGISSFALELAPDEQHTLDWYSDRIGDIEGIAYVTGSTWKFHADQMPQGIYDTVVEMANGYQISVRVVAATFVYLGS